jgi:hypothetical protein
MDREKRKDWSIHMAVVAAIVIGVILKLLGVL